MTIALVGNQNSGKTTLFNALTGSSQHVGNFPGVTVDHKIGTLKKYNKCSVVDLPGIYSLRPYSKEEIITRDFILKKKPDGIINIVDATNLERNLYLTLQLIELNIPMIIALNMMDEVRNNKGKINIAELSKKLCIPIVPISAIKNEGLDDIIIKLINNINENNKPRMLNLTSQKSIAECINTISKIIEPHTKKLNISSTFCTTQIIEGDDSFEKLLKLNLSEIKLIRNTLYKMESETDSDKNTLLASMRYNFIEKICKENIKYPKESKEHKYSEKIDKFLTSKYLSLPIFFTIMFIIFWLTFNVIGNFLSDWLTNGINYITIIIDNLLTNYNITFVLHSLIIDGIFSGVGSILGFLPIIIVLFFFLSILEDSGYMARVTFIMDSLLKKIGLSGKCFVPMLLGLGCSVPAIMATRTLPSKRERNFTILLIPYMSCSAKIPIYTFFCNAFFNKYAPIVMIGLYILGIIIGIIIALILKNTLFIKNTSPFIIEIPNYRLPSLKNTLLLMWNKAKDFIEKAFSIILIASIIIWFLKNFDLNLNIVSNAKNSIMSLIGNSLSPIFAPIGFSDWRIISSLISGILAKESIISTLSILLNTTQTNLLSAILNIFTPATSISFLIFTLLYTPCIATIGTINKELKSPIKTIIIVLFQCTIAWFISFIFFNLIKLFNV